VGDGAELKRMERIEARMMRITTTT